MTRLKAHLCLREVQGLGDVTPREFDVAAELLARLVRKLHQRERGGTVHVADARVRVADGSPYPLPVRACQEADTRTRGHEDVAYQQNRNRAEQATAMATPTRSSMWRHSGARPCAAASTVRAQDRRPACQICAPLGCRITWRHVHCVFKRCRAVLRAYLIAPIRKRVLFGVLRSSKVDPPVPRPAGACVALRRIVLVPFFLPYGVRVRQAAV